MTDWAPGGEDLDRLEIFPWTSEAAEEYPFLRDAVADFDAAGQVHANADAAAEATTWLRDHALNQRAAVTRLLVVGERIISFYTLVSADVEISSTQNLQQLGYFVPVGPPRPFRVGASHIEVVARDHRAPPGSGTLAVNHASGVAVQVSELQGNRVLTLDPRDAQTQEMWRSLGFFKTATRYEATGLCRLYIPLFGPYRGPLPR